LVSSNSIILQDGVFAYNFEAQGAIKKGQAVSMSGNNQVKVCAASENCIGVACYGAEDEQIAIAGPGNVVWACVDAAESVGTALYGDDDGIFDASQDGTERVAAYVVELPVLTSTNYRGKVLLV
jgi:uncharacterized membrane protein